MSSHVERLASGQDDQDMALQANERSLGGGCGPMFPGTRALEGGPKKMGRDARHYCDRRWSKHPTGTPMMGGGACRRWPGGGGVEVACSSMQRGPSLAVQLAARVQCVQCAVCSVQCALLGGRLGRDERRPPLPPPLHRYTQPAVPAPTHPKGPAAAEEKGPLAPSTTINGRLEVPSTGRQGSIIRPALSHTPRLPAAFLQYICMYVP